MRKSSFMFGWLVFTGSIIGCFANYEFRYFDIKIKLKPKLRMSLWLFNINLIIIHFSTELQDSVNLSTSDCTAVLSKKIVALGKIYVHSERYFPLGTLARRHLMSGLTLNSYSDKILVKYRTSVLFINMICLIHLLSFFYLKYFTKGKTYQKMFSTTYEGEEKQTYACTEHFFESR